VARRRRRTRRRRNPGPGGGAGDAEILLTVAGIGAAVWLAWGIYQATVTATNAAEGAASGALNAIESPFVSLRNWFDNLTTPSVTLDDGTTITAQ
jgi:hypothetical protein